MTEIEILGELASLGSRKAQMELASKQESAYKDYATVENKLPLSEQLIKLSRPSNLPKRKAMYCPKHKNYYRIEGNPFSNLICGYCGADNEKGHYKTEYKEQNQLR